MKLIFAISELRRVLGSKSLPDVLPEIIDTYQHDAENSDLLPERLRGFAQGLYAAGVILPEEYDDVDIAICKAEGSV